MRQCREAVGKLSVTPQILLNDAVTIPEIILPQVPIYKGRCKKRIDCSRKYCGKSHERQNDGRV